VGFFPIYLNFGFVCRKKVNSIYFHKLRGGLVGTREPSPVTACVLCTCSVRHLRRFDRARGPLTRPAPTQIKQLAISGGSVKSRLHHPLGDQVLDPAREILILESPETSLKKQVALHVDIRYAVTQLSSLWF
jgi:hypothetical protein